MNAMLPNFYRPGPPLDQFVDCLWYLPSYSVEHVRERALPTGTTELVFNLGAEAMRIFNDEQDEFGRQFERSVVCGPHSRYFVLDTSQAGHVLGVHFRAGGGFPFFPGAAHELSDRTVALEDLWGGRAHELHERLLTDASSPNQMFRILEETLRSCLVRPCRHHPAVDYAIRELLTSPHILTIRKLEIETGYSPKHFIQLFSESVGLTPKVFSRIQRFQAVLTRKTRGDHVDWSDVAVANGYYDQSHLNREFRVFSGVTPTQYEPVSQQRPNHLPV